MESRREYVIIVEDMHLQGYDVLVFDLQAGAGMLVLKMCNLCKLTVNSGSSDPIHDYTCTWGVTEVPNILVRESCQVVLITWLREQSTG